MSAVVAKWAIAFSKFGYSVTVFCPRFEGPLSEADLEYLDILEKNNILIKTVESHKAKRVRINLLSIDMMQNFEDSFFEKLNVVNLGSYAGVISWSPFHSINNLLYRLKSVQNFNWIATFCDPWADNPIEKSFIRSNINKKFQKLNLSLANFIVHSSKKSLELMAAALPDIAPSCFKLIPNIINKFDLEQNKYPVINFSNKITIRYIGTLFGERKPDSFLKALKKLTLTRPDLANKVQVDFIGQIDQVIILNNDLLYLIRKDILKIYKNVHYLDSLSYMNTADYLLLIDPDEKYGQFIPSKLYDYLSTSKPIIAITGNDLVRQELKNLGHSIFYNTEIDTIVNFLIRILDKIEKPSIISPKDSEDKILAERIRSYVALFKRN